MSGAEAQEGKLDGLSVLITRPSLQQHSLSEKISSAGGKPLSLPLIEIVALENSSEIDSTRRAVQDLDRFSLLIFVSSNAAQIGGELINDYWPQFPVGIEVIAIGKTTADTVIRQLACSVTSPEQGSDSEAVLALPLLQTVTDKRIAIFRGKGGRELLANTLRERGAEVAYIEVYSRKPVSYSPTEIMTFLSENACDVITVHSGESLQNLVEQSADNINQITLLPLVVPSQRIAEQARQIGFAEVICANGADDEAMLEALQQLS